MKTFVCLFFISISVFAQQEQEPISPDEELTRLNTTLFKNYALDNNTELFELTASDDFMLVSAIGHLETKEQATKGVKNVILTDLKVTTDTIIVKQNVGIVIGVLKMEGTIMKRPIPNDFRYMSVFIKEGENWKLQSRSMTPILKIGKQ
ncbi:MAG: nuclear transport factor 2 family protein [Gelidibacter sp.]